MDPPTTYIWPSDLVLWTGTTCDPTEPHPYKPIPHQPYDQMTSCPTTTSPLFPASVHSPTPTLAFCTGAVPVPCDMHACLGEPFASLRDHSLASLHSPVTSLSQWISACGIFDMTSSSSSMTPRKPVCVLSQSRMMRGSPLPQLGQALCLPFLWERQTTLRQGHCVCAW